MENLEQAANTEQVELATPIEETTETVTETTEPVVEEVTQTQAFARRLKEETERAKQEAKEETWQQARDTMIAEQYTGQLWKGKLITTETELKQALKEQEAEESFREKYSHLDEDVIQELLAGKQFREKFEQKENETVKEQQERQKQEKEQAEQYQDQQEFLKMFKDENTRAWDETDSLPSEVTEFLKQGKSLADSYTKYLASTYKQKLGAQEVNERNANSSTGSVTGNGNGKDSTLTQEMIDNMTPKELANRWSEVKTLFKMK